MVPKGAVKFQNIIYATDSFHKTEFLNRVKTTVAVSRRISSEKINKLGIALPFMFEDTGGEDYYYVKFTRDRRLLVGYGDSKMRRSDTSSNSAGVPHPEGWG